MQNSTNKKRSAAEPEPQREADTTSDINSARRIITLRISSIPIAIEKDSLVSILECLSPRQQRINTGKRYRGTNIDSYSIAPSASAFDCDRYQVATVTFKEIPSIFAGCQSSNKTILIEVGEAGKQFEVVADSNFHGLTPLNKSPNPSVEYAETSISTIPLISVTLEYSSNACLD